MTASNKPVAKQARKAAGMKGAAPVKEVKAEPKPPRVRLAVLTGGYRVYGTPVEPKHTTRAKIAQAIASVK